MRRNIILAVEDQAWRKPGVELSRLRTAARLALERALHAVIPGENARETRAFEGRGPRGQRSSDAKGNSGRFHRHYHVLPRLLGPLPSPRNARLAGDDRKGEHWELTILLTNDARLRALNARFRGKDAPTNVLSFPALETSRGYLGDVAIALGVAEHEAATAGIPLSAHTLHLVVHGVLHLLGYDHAQSRKARAMERLETAILAELGIPSPYAHAAAAE